MTDIFDNIPDLISKYDRSNVYIQLIDILKYTFTDITQYFKYTNDVIIYQLKSSNARFILNLELTMSGHGEFELKIVKYTASYEEILEQKVFKNQHSIPNFAQLLIPYIKTYQLKMKLAIT